MPTQKTSSPGKQRPTTCLYLAVPSAEHWEIPIVGIEKVRALPELQRVSTHKDSRKKAGQDYTGLLH